MKYFNLKLFVLSLFILLFVSACNSSSSSTTSSNKDSNNEQSEKKDDSVTVVVDDESNSEEDENNSSSESNETTQTKNTSTFTYGTAVDPYIQGATFFWDKNKNGIQESNEPISTKSNINGWFEFKNLEITFGERLVMKDKGTHNGVAYTGSLTSNISQSGVISPLTSLEVEFPDSNIVTLLSDAGIVISQTDIHKNPMVDKTVNLTTATLAIDTFLKINNLNNVQKDINTLPNIVATIKSILTNDVSDDNINNVVKINDLIVSKTTKDGNLDELTKIKNNATYSINLKNTMSKMTSQEASQVDELGNDGLSVIYKYPLLDEKIFSFDKSPVVGEESKVTINVDDLSGVDIVWSVENEPNTSNFSIEVDSSKKFITFTPSVKGTYSIAIKASSGNASAKKTTTFNVVEILTIGNKNESVDANSSVLIGTVSNQSWVSSKSLDESELTTLIDNFSELSKNGFSASKGLLISYDDTSSLAKEQLEELKLQTGIDSIVNRVYHNENAYGGSLVLPNDNGAFDDGGSNWHLEAIHMPQAWEYTKGTEEFLLGVSDGGFDTLHDDLQGRFASILTSAKHSHGMGVTGAMIATSDNKKGISGINWKVQAVASYMGGSYVEDVITTKKDGKEVKLINNSWGYHIPTSFYPSNNSVAQSRFNTMQNIFAQIRQLVGYYDNKLFFWAAGNGIGNGLGNSNGVYGVDAKYDNGVLHYKDGQLSKLDNLLIVGAFVENKTLVYYSEYGQSVDIAAPTHFDSLSTNNNIYHTFGGTSAATPVATAVASLVYAINPSLSAKEVKDILINSATEYITQRQINPSGTLEYLAHPIPMLNALEAVKLAQKTIEQKISVSYEVSDIIEPKIQLTYTSSSNKYEVVSLSSEVFSSTTQENYSTFSNASSSNNKVEISLDKDKRHHEISADVTLKYLATGETFVQNHKYQYAYSDISINTIDNVSLSDIASVSISINKLDSNMSLVSATSDANANLKIYVDEGVYRLVGTKSNYSSSIKDIAISKDMGISTDLALTPDTIVKQGSISGFVYDENGVAINGALVRISAGALTNGYFTSTNTNSDGYYKLTSISKTASSDFDNVDIVDFTMAVSKDKYIETLRSNVIVLDAKERTENFNLIKKPIIEQSEYIYVENFENNISDWNTTGLWHKQENNSGIVNQSITNGEGILLAPDDNGSGEIPNTNDGNYSMWYGNSAKGNFNDGSNGGTLISPSITIGDINSTLEFSSWWEIESVNPNINGFDLLEIYIVEEGKDYNNKCVNFKIDPNKSEILNKYGALNWPSSVQDNLIDMQYQIECGYIGNESKGFENGDLVKKLNPAIDPKGYDYIKREKMPFTSAGFNRKAIWNNEQIDLSKYSGKTIKLKFKFNTVDPLYNNFRGWMIDNIKIVETSKLNK